MANPDSIEESIGELNSWRERWDAPGEEWLAALTRGVAGPAGLSAKLRAMGDQGTGRDARCQLTIEGPLSGFQTLWTPKGQGDAWAKLVGSLRAELPAPSMPPCPPPQASERERHVARLEKFEPMLAALAWGGRDIIEFGAGSGALTQALIRAGVASVEAWEIDESLPPVRHPSVRWRARDIAMAAPEDVALRDIACFAPYAMLDAVLALAADVEDVMVMAPPERLPGLLALGYRALGSLAGEDFDPPAEGAHFVVAKGFEQARAAVHAAELAPVDGPLVAGGDSARDQARGACFASEWGADIKAWGRKWARPTRRSP